MSVEIKSFVRPTTIVRSVMRAHGKKSYMIWTNTYKNCRTVKCYSRGATPVELIGDIRTALIKAGVNDFSIKMRPFSSFFRPADSLIVRIARTEQA